MISDPIELILEDYLKPYVAPLGVLVVCCARAEFNLLELIMLISGKGPKDAIDIINKDKKGKTKEARVAELINESPKLSADKIESLDAYFNQFCEAKSERNRLIHDDYAPGWDEQNNEIVVVTAGRKLSTPEKLEISEPTVEHITNLARKFAECAMVFDDCYHDLIREMDDRL